MDWLQERKDDVTDVQRLAIEKSREDGVVWETHRRIGIAEALAMLAGAGWPIETAESSS